MSVSLFAMLQKMRYIGNTPDFKKELKSGSDYQSKSSQNGV
jgi:hypothetical protein